MRLRSDLGAAGLAFVALVGLLGVRPAVAALDADADGFPATFDCNDYDDQVWALPGQALDIRFTSKVTFTWSLPADPGGSGSLKFDTLRSTSPSNFALTPQASCFDPEGLTPSSTDAANPPKGTAFFYLVAAKNSCGRGSLGNRSNGTPRIGIVCDCSAVCSDGNACTRDYCADGACAHDPIPPVVQAQPQAVAVCPGSDAHFSVRASGQGTLHYQWKTGPFVVGNDAPSLTLSGVAAGDNGAAITCTVTDGCASQTTAAAVLTVFSSAVSCSGGGSGQEAPGGASSLCYDPPTAIRPPPNVMVLGDLRRQFTPDVVPRNTLGSLYLFSGEYYLEETDLAIEGRGFDFVWTRKYRSMLDRLSGQGQNWDFGYNLFIAPDLPGTDLIVADGNSRRDRYRKPPPAAGRRRGSSASCVPSPMPRTS